VTRLLAGILVALLVALTSGCELSEDDEMAQRPKRTVTKSPAPAVPTKVPVGQGKISPEAVVWAQDSTLHFGNRQVDVSPLNIDSFVVVPGGVYFLSRGELWFTDLSRARGTGVMGVTRLTTTRDAGALRVEVAAGSGPAKVYAFDLGTGASMPADQAVPATDADLRGTRKRIMLRSGTNDGASSETSVDVRLGPGSGGGYGVVGGDGGGLVVIDATTRRRVPLEDVTGTGFKLVRWQNRIAFFGIAMGEGGKPLAVMSCNLSSRSCTTSGEIDPDRSLVFESAS
jgi:hypothetical protein